MDASDPAVRTERARAKAKIKLQECMLDADGKISGAVERAVWNLTLNQFLPSERYWDNPSLRYKYTTKVLGIAFNLKNPKNPSLRQRVMSGEVPAAKLVKMTPYDLFPELWAPVYERVAHKQLRKQLTVDAESAPDGAFTCKCKSKKTVFYQMQTRSADEPMTLFIQCLSCGRRWKQ